MGVARVGIFSAFGGHMEVGTVDDCEQIPNDPDDLLECDEDDELEMRFTNDSMIFLEGKMTAEQHVLNELINTPTVFCFGGAPYACRGHATAGQLAHLDCDSPSGKHACGRRHNCRLCVLSGRPALRHGHPHI